MFIPSLDSGSVLSTVSTEINGVVLLKILSEFLDNSRISDLTNRGLPEISSNSKMAADDSKTS